MSELNTELVKAMTRPTFFIGVPVAFFIGNLLFWSSVIVFGDLWNRYPVIGFVFIHAVVFYIMTENPAFFHQFWAFLRCKFRNYRRGAFGATYYSPVNYKKSLNYSK